MTTLPVTVASSCVERNASASRRSFRALRYAILFLQFTRLRSRVDDHIAGHRGKVMR